MIITFIKVYSSQWWEEAATNSRNFGATCVAMLKHRRKPLAYYLQSISGHSISEYLKVRYTLVNVNIHRLIIYILSSRRYQRCPLLRSWLLYYAVIMHVHVPLTLFYPFKLWSWQHFGIQQVVVRFLLGLKSRRKSRRATWWIFAHGHQQYREAMRCQPLRALRIRLLKNPSCIVFAIVANWKWYYCSGTKSILLYI